jgi:hypothetical protein
MIAPAEALEFRAVLPAAVGVNHSYKAGHPRWGKMSHATAWEDEAALELAAAGFRPLPLGRYWVRLDFLLYSMALDADAPTKLAVDAVFRALCWDDRWLGQLTITKILVRHRNEERLEVHCVVHPVADKAAFNVLSEQAAAP